MRVLVSAMALGLPYRTKFRVFTGKAYAEKPLRQAISPVQWHRRTRTNLTKSPQSHIAQRADR
jgi:hypothetical protein